jgi:phage-related protein
MKLSDLPLLKPLRFIKSSRDDIKEFPAKARRLAGEQLMLVQSGKMPEDWKPMTSIGTGVFLKTTQKTQDRELDKARKSYAEMLNDRKRQG